jgi:hypothetical protein
VAEIHQPRAAHASNGSPDHVEIHHEESDVNIYAVFAFGAGLLVIGAIVSLLIFVLFRYLDVREAARVPPAYPLAISRETRMPPEPRLQTDPRQDLSDLLAKEDELLTSYGWVDKNAGVVRIPIDQAIKLTLERGLPARTEQAR